MKSSAGVVWRRTATEKWLRENGVAIDRVTHGHHAIVEQPHRAQFSLEYFCVREAEAARLQNQFGGAVEYVPTDWLELCAREQLHLPIRVGRRLTVVADAAIAPTTDTLVIPAGAAFGTGDHATTAMSLRLLEKLTRAVPDKWSMLDAGTGSGILVLAGKRFGATKALGFDNDSRAVKTAKANAKLNHLAHVNFRIGDVMRPMPEAPFDIITANLFSGLLISAAPVFRAQLRDDGHLIASGILHRQEREVTQAFRSSGFKIIIRRRRGKWIALAAVLSPRARLAAQKAS